MKKFGTTTIIYLLICIIILLGIYLSNKQVKNATKAQDIPERNKNIQYEYLGVINADNSTSATDKEYLYKVKVDTNVFLIVETYSGGVAISKIK